MAMQSRGGGTCSDAASSAKLSSYPDLTVLVGLLNLRRVWQGGAHARESLSGAGKAARRATRGEDVRLIPVFRKPMLVQRRGAMRLHAGARL